MFSQSAQIALSDSTQIVLGIGQIIIFIGVIWKIAIDSARTKHDISNLKKTQDEADKLRKEKWESHKDDHKEEKEKHFEEHKEIKKTMDLYQHAIHELKTDFKTMTAMNTLQFQTIESKIDQTQAMILSVQNLLLDKERIR